MNNAHIMERILLVIRASSDKQHIEFVAKELDRAISWAYKWYNRYNNEGLKDKPSGEPSVVSKEVKDKIKQEYQIAT